MKRLAAKFDCKWTIGRLSIPVLSIALLAVPACNRKEELIVIPKLVQPIDEARSLLNRYANGSPIGSEGEGLITIAEEVAKSDPSLGNSLKTGFKMLLDASPSERSRIAKELLKQLN